MLPQYFLVLQGSSEHIVSVSFTTLLLRDVIIFASQENIYFYFIDHAKAFDCVDHNKLENFSRDESTRPPYLPPEKSVFRSRNNG